MIFDRLIGAGLALSLALVIAEAVQLVFVRRARYASADSATSLIIAVGQAFTSPLSTPWLANALFAPVFARRAFTVTLDAWWKWLLLWLLVELVYYWFHRWNHRVRWFWATHQVHHSSTYMNLTAAFRFGWTGVVSCYFLVWAPLVWLGLPPKPLFAVLTLSMIYQGWLHTELVGRLPRPLEWLLNTPSRHRVHHASNGGYVDRNFGGVLMIFDHLFGTAAEERDEEPCRYGLGESAPVRHPLAVIAAPWLALAADLRAARSLRAVLRCCLGPPPRSEPTPRQE